MASLTVMLKKHRKKNDGTYPIVIRVHAAGKSRFEYTGFSVKENQYRDDPLKWIKGHPDAALINNRIEGMRRDILARIDQDAGYLPVAASKLTSLSDYLTKRAQGFKDADNPNMDRRLRRYKDEIEAYQGRKVFFQEITIEWIRGYVAFCKAEYGNIHNTLMRKVKNLRTIYDQAITDGMAAHPNPFRAYKITYEPTHKEKLTRAEIAKLESVYLEPGKLLAHSRNAFLFAYYCQGMRFQNVFTLRWADISKDILTYRMNKGKKIREIKLHPKALAILQKYKRTKEGWVFPFCKRQWRSEEDFLNMKGSADTMVNAALKTIAKLADIDKPISFHIARHSFAYAMKTAGVNMHIIKDSLGHSDMKTTENYLNDLDDDVINEAVNQAFD